MKHRGFEKKLVDQVIKPQQLASSSPGYGIVLSYDSVKNTATVLMSQPGSDAPGGIYSNVPCPTIMGVQGVAPEPGRMCNVMFKSGNNEYPMIVSFFNYIYDEVDYTKQSYAPAPMPYFMRYM